MGYRFCQGIKWPLHSKSNDMLLDMTNRKTLNNITNRFESESLWFPEIHFTNTNVSRFSLRSIDIAMPFAPK